MTADGVTSMSTQRVFPSRQVLPGWLPSQSSTCFRLRACGRGGDCRVASPMPSGRLYGH
jgi:hypothetical protein